MVDLNELLATQKHEIPEAVLTTEIDKSCTLDLSPSTSIQETEEEEEIEFVGPNLFNIEIINFLDFFEKNRNNLEYINRIRLDTIRGLSPTENLAITIPKTEGSEERDIYIFKDPTRYIVLDHPISSFKVFPSNSFKLTYHYSENISLKSYCTKGHMDVIAMYNHPDGLQIPYEIKRLTFSKKGNIEKNLEFSEPDIELISSRIDAECPIDDVLSILPVFKKKKNELNLNRDLIEFFTEFAKGVEDINYHLKLDNILISILAK